jgi:signal peptidase I
MVQAFTIPSSSMEKTLLVGDHLLVNKFGYAAAPERLNGLLPYQEVQRGDIIVFKYPYSPYPHFVKRAVGLPGDRLKIVKRRVFINGEPLEEPYKIHDSTLPRRLNDNFPSSGSYHYYSVEAGWAEQVQQLIEGDEIVLPPGKYFALGDNRDNSQDSRYWGLVDRSNIVGRPLLIYWSFARPEDMKEAAEDEAGPKETPRWSNALTALFSRARWGRFLRFVQ